MNIKEQLKQLKRVFPVVVEGVDNLFVRRMSPKELLDFFENMKKYKEDYQYGALLIVATCCDADGNLIFDESEIDQVLGYPTDVVTAIALKAQEVNYMTEASREELKKS